MKVPFLSFSAISLTTFLLVNTSPYAYGSAYHSNVLPAVPGNKEPGQHKVQSDEDIINGITQDLRTRGATDEQIRSVLHKIQMKDFKPRHLKRAIEETKALPFDLDFIESLAQEFADEERVIVIDPIANFLVEYMGMSPDRAARDANQIRLGGEREGRVLADLMRDFRNLNPKDPQGGVDALSKLAENIETSRLLDPQTSERFLWAVDRVSNLERMTKGQRSANYDSLSQPPVKGDGAGPADEDGHGLMLEEYSKKMIPMKSAKRLYKYRTHLGNNSQETTEQEKFAKRFLETLGVTQPAAHKAAVAKRDLEERSLQELENIADKIKGMFEKEKGFNNNNNRLLEELYQSSHKTKDLKGILERIKRSAEESERLLPYGEEYRSSGSAGESIRRLSGQEQFEGVQEAIDSLRKAVKSAGKPKQKKSSAEPSN